MPQTDNIRASLRRRRHDRATSLLSNWLRRAGLGVGEEGAGRARGAVHAFYGQSGGLVVNATGSALDDQYFSQGTPGVPGNEEDFDQFGASTAFGDFNSDGCADLAIGAPGEDDSAGTVTILYGTPTGLITADAQRFTIAGLVGSDPGAPQAFGDVLAVGDLNNDLVEDLAVGAPVLQVGRDVFAGGVAVLYGDRDGLNAGMSAELITQDSAAVPGGAEREDGFGAALAIGNFGPNVGDHLAIGVPGENGVGAVQAVRHGASGFVGGPVITQNTAGVPGASEQGDCFGCALAAGDTDDDGNADLAVGVPGENNDPDADDGGPLSGEGAVVLLRGSDQGLTGAGSQLWSQRTAGVDGVAGIEDRFGTSLAMGFLDEDPTKDLVLGTPRDAISSIKAAGSVTVLLGGPGGLSTRGIGRQRLQQDVSGLAGTAESGDRFGADVATSLVQRADRASIVIGAPGETVGGIIRTGQFHQLSATTSGPSTSGGRTLHLDSSGVKGVPGRNKSLGLGLG